MTKFYTHRKWCGFCGESKGVTDSLTCDVCGRVLRTTRRYEKSKLEVARM